MIYQFERETVAFYGRKMFELGLIKGTGGNLSLLTGDGQNIAITPSAVPYNEIEADDVVIISKKGALIDGARKASTELSLHLALYESRPDIKAVVHTHSLYCSILACLGWEIPPIHYYIAFCGDKVPVAPYATFGTKELARKTASTIGTNKAVLLANHGMVAVGSSIKNALMVAEVVEFLAEIYYKARCAGNPMQLELEEIERLRKAFGDYCGGQRSEKSC